MQVQPILFRVMMKLFKIINSFPYIYFKNISFKQDFQIFENVSRQINGIKVKY